MVHAKIDSDFLRYLLAHGCQAGTQLPALSQISEEMGISVGKLREQLEVARALGLVEARPRRGIRCKEYSFLPAVQQSLMFALSLDRQAFADFSALRCHLEVAFWDEAVTLLTTADKERLCRLVEDAQEKLNQDRIQIPHTEHRAFHLTIFSRLDNVFVSGLLEAYWEAYEAADLSTYADYQYLKAVWQYHEQIAEAIAAGDYSQGKEILIAHMQLLDTRGVSLESSSDLFIQPAGSTHPNGSKS